MTNPSNQYVTFKVLTNDPRRYAVHPNYGLVAPGACTNVVVDMQPLRNDDAVKAFLATKQKFMISWRALAGTPDFDEPLHALVSANNYILS